MTTGVLRIERENPARTDELVGSVDATDPAGVHAAVARARSAQRAWVAMDLPTRCAAVRTGADLIAAEIDDLAVLMARETGKVLPDCRGELGFSVTVLRWAADRAEELLADQVVDDEAGRLLIRRRAYGVVAAVTPWNAPVILAVLKLGPALVSGNAVVVKPSPLAPFAIERVVQLLEAGLVSHGAPEGVVQVVQGDAETATALVGHPGVDRVAFTGGERAGRAIAALAGQSLTPTLMELGGNDAALLLEDADLGPDAMDRLVMATFATSGQVCMAVKRLLVPRRRHDEIVEAYRSAAERVLRLGDPLHDGVTIGPVVSAPSAVRVRGLVEAAVERGAESFVLGSVDPATDLSRGYYLRPSAGDRRLRPRPAGGRRAVRPGASGAGLRLARRGRRPRQRRRPGARRVRVVRGRGARLRGRRAARRGFHVRQHAQPHRHVAASAFRRGEALRLGSGVRRRGRARAHPAVRGPRAGGLPRRGSRPGRLGLPGLRPKCDPKPGPRSRL